MKIRDMIADLGGEKITIVRTNGDTFADVPAIVNENSAHFDAADGAVDIGDEILRETPTGTVTYIVEDPGYYAKSSGFSAHFQSKIRRANKPSNRQFVAINSLTMNDNAKFNLNSTDNSTNVIHKDNVYKELGSKLRDGVPDVKLREEALLLVELMKSAKTEAELHNSISRIMSLGVQVSAIVGPFIPVLATLLVASG